MTGLTRTGMAERTGLEPATSNVTGWRSNQLSYRSIPFGWAGRYGESRKGAISFLEESAFFSSFYEMRLPLGLRRLFLMD